MMSPRLRKLSLTAHIAFSVSWIGAVAAFLVLSFAGLYSQNTEVVRGAYLSMNLIGLYVIVPASLASLTTGLIQGLGTQWGLFKYYWVSAKFLLAIFATIALLLHQFTAVEGAAKLVLGTTPGTLPEAELRSIGIQLLADASLAIVVLLTATILSVYKPWGLIRKQRSTGVSNATMTNGLSRGSKILLAIISLLILAFIILHLTGNGLGHHGH